ncbi:MAG: hypothetical protein WAK40_00805 [Thermoplasmata archaeon]
MTEESGNPDVPAGLAIAVILLAGLSIAIISYFARSNDALFMVLLGTGSALIAASAVIAFERLVPPWTQRIQVYRSHADIYSEFERMLNGLRGGPHEIRTINSFLPESTTEERWDSFVTNFLRSHKDVTFIRVVSGTGTDPWRLRLERIRERYGSLPNYHQHPALAEGSVPPIEMFLVDDREVLLSYGTVETVSAPVTFGIKMRDPLFCRQLQAYHRSQLEARFKRENLQQQTLDREGIA